LSHRNGKTEKFGVLINVFGTSDDSYRACEFELYSGIIWVVLDALDIKKISQNNAANYFN